VGDHPVKVPAELVRQWMAEFYGTTPTFIGEVTTGLANKAAQWGADQELEACCDWLRSQHHSDTWPNRLRAARRPKPPTLAEQGMEALRSTPCTEQHHYDALFAALNRLAELEANQ
jgi:hypothetical protein